MKKTALPRFCMLYVTQFGTGADANLEFLRDSTGITGIAWDSATFRYFGTPRTRMDKSEPFNNA